MGKVVRFPKSGFSPEGEQLKRARQRIDPFLPKEDEKGICVTCGISRNLQLYMKSHLPRYARPVSHRSVCPDLIRYCYFWSNGRWNSPDIKGTVNEIANSK